MNRRAVALHMAAELEASRLEVTLITAKLGCGKVRVVVSENPRWYQKLCALYSRTRGRWRKLKTYIKRRETITALYRIARGLPCGVYAQRLKPLMREVERDWRAEGMKYA